jgi:hypothetical protein
MSGINSVFSLLRFKRRNWKAVALCFFAATVFWFFNALNKNYTTNITFPLAFDYNEDNYVAVRPLPDQVRINVTGIGWDLFRRSIGLKVPPLVIPLEHPSRIKKITGGSLPSLFVNQLDRFEINFVLTDTLHLALEPKGSRWITLSVDSPSLIYQRGYVRTSDIDVEPDSIFIEGPWKLINTFKEPFALKIQRRNIDAPFKEDVEVSFLNNELIKRNPPTVSVSFKVEKLVSVQDSITLEIINYPKGANPYYGVKALPCTLAIPESFVEDYQSDSVRAIVDLRDFIKGTKKILPQVIGLPPYSRVQEIDSVFVKF